MLLCLAPKGDIHDVAIDSLFNVMHSTFQQNTQFSKQTGRSRIYCACRQHAKICHDSLLEDGYSCGQTYYSIPANASMSLQTHQQLR